VVERVPDIRSLRPADDALSEGWALALRLAWESCRARTTPVGAVVDDTGAVLAAGRGRRYEVRAPAGQLAGTHIAHAR